MAKLVVTVDQVILLLKSSINNCMKKYNYSRMKDSKNISDPIYQNSFQGSLPSLVDLRHLCPPVVDQGQEGSCTAQASVSGVYDFLQLKNIRIVNPHVDPLSVFAPGSRQFVYYNERTDENTVQQDSGAELRDIIFALSQYGVCPESMWPYTNNDMTVKPSDDCYKSAANNKIKDNFRIVSLDQMKDCLANGYPFIMGIDVYDSFESEQVAQTGKVPLPLPSESCQGGHEITCVGFDDKNSWLICRNSWGADWGDKGYFYLPYSFVTNPNLAEDFWTYRLA